MRLRITAAALLACALATSCLASSRSPYPIDRAAAARLNARQLGDSIGRILEAAIRDSAFPGAIAVVGTADGVVLQRSAGRIDWTESPSPGVATLWDLASLTKVIGLTSAMMLLVERGMVDLDAPAQRYLTEWSGPGKELVTIRHLLTHSSGLPAWRPLYKEADSPAAALSLAMSTGLDTLPGVRMVYSDIGAILLGQVVVRVTGRPFEEFLRNEVFGPLDMRETLFRPPEHLRERIAPTEVDPWRGRHLRGEVHDENAFALGGVSSHAGLFSTAGDLVRIARMYLGGGVIEGRRFLAAETIDRFTALQDPALSHRALGWEKPNGGNSAGRLMSPRAFGHTGFTGTSIWMDPDRGIFVLLLTNRVNPTRERRQISRVRTDVADAAMGAVLNGNGR